MAACWISTGLVYYCKLPTCCWPTSLKSACAYILIPASGSPSWAAAQITHIWSLRNTKETIIQIFVNPFGAFLNPSCDGSSLSKAAQSSVSSCPGAPGKVGGFHCYSTFSCHWPTMDDKNFSVDMLKYELELIIAQGYWNSRFIQRIPLKKD